MLRSPSRAFKILGTKACRAVIETNREGNQISRNAFDRVVERRGTDSIKWGHYDADVLPMWVADMDFPSPPAVIEALRERANHGVFGYPTEPPGLRDLFVDRLKRLYGWTVSPDDLLFLPNVVVGFNLTCHAVAAAGDGITYQTPVYFPILRIPEHAGLKACVNELQRAPSGRYEIDFDAFEHCAARSRVFVLCNPHNPVSRVFTEDELARLADVCLRHDVIVCSDEIHADFLYDGRRHVPAASLSREMAQNSVTLFAPNKTFNIAGVACAIAVVPNETLRRRIVAAERGLVPHVGVMSYAAALAAYQHGDEWLAGLLRYLQENRDALTRFISVELPEIAVTPIEGTYLAWLDCRQVIQESPHEFFLREARVAVNDGSTFGQGGGGFARLNFGCPRSTLLEALQRIRDALRHA